MTPGLHGGPGRTTSLSTPTLPSPAAEIENYINLARKREKSQTLSMVVNRDQATSMEIYKALREFCDIPMGEVYISPRRGDRHPRGPDQPLHLQPAALHHPGQESHHDPRHGPHPAEEPWSRRRPGKLGGKAAGMILAQKILLPLLEKQESELEEYIRVPDTWYLNSGVFSEFLDRNNLYLFHTYKYKEREEIEKEFHHIEEKFRYATFAPEVVEDFRQILEEIGEHPIIIRSSSLLEDSFGLAFSGKYLSVFLTNQGDIETRLSRIHQGAETGLYQHLRPGPDPLPAGPRPPGL